MKMNEDEEVEKSEFNILNLLESKKLVKVCAPMVRYSKLQFRNLLKDYDCDLFYTPMILADSFCKSQKARCNEFTTNKCDSPLITQFAANAVHDFVGAAYMVSPFCNGVDLNCGCPQGWARQMGLGCVMLKKPQIIYDIVRECRNRVSKPFTVSVKMRLCKDMKQCVEICRQLEKCGVSFISVHARTPDILTGDINVDALKLIRESVQLPMIANGGLKSLEDCLKLQRAVKCQGVMVANGLLTNPTLFSGSDVTTVECVQKWIDICYNSTLTTQEYLNVKGCDSFFIQEKPNNLTFQCFHHHLVFMLEKILTKTEKRIFNNFQNFRDVLDFLNERFAVSPKPCNSIEFQECRQLNLNYKNRDRVYLSLKPHSSEDRDDLGLFYQHNDDVREGKYFKSKTTDDDCDWSNIFLENG